MSLEKRAKRANGLSRACEKCAFAKHLNKDICFMCRKSFVEGYIKGHREKAKTAGKSPKKRMVLNYYFAAEEGNYYSTKIVAENSETGEGIEFKTDLENNGLTDLWKAIKKENPDYCFSNQKGFFKEVRELAELASEAGRGINKKLIK